MSSTSPVARQVTEYKAIPKRILINDISELPNDYSSTPGGTLYSTTPGGTRIVYDKSFLMGLRNSPVSKTPPSYSIPEQLLLSNQQNNGNNNNNNNNVKKCRAPPKKRNQPPIIITRATATTTTNKKEDELFDLEI